MPTVKRKPAPRPKAIPKWKVYQPDGGETEIEVEVITPDKDFCEAALAKQVHRQRSQKPGNMVRIETDLKDGEWWFNGDTIVFSPNGYLLNGQHRLQAFLNTGIFPPILVIRGIPEKAYRTKDVGVPRSPADHFAAVGIPAPSVTSTTAKFIWRYLNRKDGRLANNAHLTRHQLEQTYWDHEDEIGYWRGKHGPLCSFISSRGAIVAAGVLLEKVYDRQEVEDFYRDFTAGMVEKSAKRFWNEVKNDNLKPKKGITGDQRFERFLTVADDHLKASDRKQVKQAYIKLPDLEDGAARARARE